MRDITPMDKKSRSAALLHERPKGLMSGPIALPE
jgi:hypothetical protein